MKGRSSCPLYGRPACYSWVSGSMFFSTLCQWKYSPSGWPPLLCPSWIFFGLVAHPNRTRLFLAPSGPWHVQLSKHIGQHSIDNVYCTFSWLRPDPALLFDVDYSLEMSVLTAVLLSYPSNQKWLLRSASSSSSKLPRLHFPPKSHHSSATSSWVWIVSDFHDL